MSLKETPSQEQSIGCDPNSPNHKSKRNSGLFAFFKWFKSSPSQENIDTSSSSSKSSSCDSLNSIQSAGTVASFSFVPPNAYDARVTEKCINVGPETDTYKARLKQRDKRRENDKNVTLRKKYNLFFNRESSLFQRASRRVSALVEDENTKSLPLMTHTSAMELEEEPNKVHRRTNSESSKLQRAGAYLHVKGKRRAPQPPGGKSHSFDGSSSSNSTSLKRNKKRIAPAPPPNQVIKEHVEVSAEVLCNDSLKLDHGILKPAKELPLLKSPSENSIVVANNVSPRASCYNLDTPVSPRPWYKRNSRENVSNNNNYYKKSSDKENKYETILVEQLPEVQFMRNSSLDLTLEDAIATKKEEVTNKRRSGLAFLTNISELDREASEILKSNKESGLNLTDLRPTATEIPEFMRPKEVNNMDSWVSPKRRSARDLIAKFNAITNVTKVTVFGGASQQKDKFFGKQQSLDESRQRQEALLETHKKRIEEIDKKKEDRFSPLMKSESASAVKKPETPKLERKSWKCPKCNLDNEYWRIICHVCSAIKPYFDDFAPSTSNGGSNNSGASKDGDNRKVIASENKSSEVKQTKPSSPLLLTRKEVPLSSNSSSVVEQSKVFERSKTQIGFSALASYNVNKNKRLEKIIGSEDVGASKANKESGDKKDERERLKKMLIEMKNSLPKRKSNILLKQSGSNNRASIIVENPTEGNNSSTTAEEKRDTDKEDKEGSNKKEDGSKVIEKSQEQKVAEILIGTTTTIYENIKMRKTDNPKPLKVSSSSQTSAVVKKTLPSAAFRSLLENSSAPSGNDDRSKNYEPMKLKDFEDIYSGDNKNSPARIYANLAQNDELSLFFNVPKNLSELKNSTKNLADNNTDTIEINRLLRRLETAIAKGDLTEAAIFAKELAQLRVSCSVIRQKPQVGGGSAGGGELGSKNKGFQIEMYVEDKVSHRGPFPIEVIETQTVADLKKQIEDEFEIPTNVQRWILGKELVTDDSSTLKDHKIKEGCAVFLYLVTPDKKSGPPVSIIKSTTSITSNLPEPNFLQKPQNNEPSSSNNNSCSTKKLSYDNQTSNTSQSYQVEDEKRKTPNTNNKDKTLFSSPEETKNKTSTIANTEANTTAKLENSTDHVPKIVNIIPKLLASNKQKSEIIRIIPVQLETKPKPIEVVSVTYLEKPIANQRAVVHEKPTVILNSASNINSNNKPVIEVSSNKNVISTTEMKIEIKECNSKEKAITATETKKENNVKNIVNNNKPLVSAYNSSLNSSVLPTAVSNGSSSSFKMSSSVSVPSSSWSNSNKTADATNHPQVPSTSSSSPGALTETTNTPKSSTTIFSTTKEKDSEPPKTKLHQPPKAKIEEDFLVEDYDSNTLRPTKNAQHEVTLSKYLPQEPQTVSKDFHLERNVLKDAPEDAKVTRDLPQTKKASTYVLPQEPKLSKDLPAESKVSRDLPPESKVPPPQEWECHLCTLLNPIVSNVCAVCATVRVSKVERAVSAVQAAPAPKKSVKKRAPQPNVAGKKAAGASGDQTYLQLVNLDSADLVENVESFECLVCFLEIPPRRGVTLRECLHQFCKTCLAHTIEYTDDAEIKCPYRDDDYSCDIALQDREIKALVPPTLYEQYLARSVAQAENKMDKSFHCKTPDCKGWCIFEDNVNEFRCPVCRKTNCLTCQAIHAGMNCRQYQEKMHQESEIDEDAKRTRDMLDEMVDKGEALTCPTCKVVLMKKWGCDWLRCSMCKTEICWVTRGPRWGPGGKGDTTGGCQCGVNGVKCHPKCNYCH